MHSRTPLLLLLLQVGTLLAQQCSLEVCVGGAMNDDDYGLSCCINVFDYEDNCYITQDCVTPRGDAVSFSICTTDGMTDSSVPCPHGVATINKAFITCLTPYTPESANIAWAGVILTPATMYENNTYVQITCSV